MKVRHGYYTIDDRPGKKRDLLITFTMDDNILADLLGTIDAELPDGADLRLIEAEGRLDHSDPKRPTWVMELKARYFV